MSREKCTPLLNRVEEVLAVIADAEASKEVDISLCEVVLGLIQN